MQINIVVLRLSDPPDHLYSTFGSTPKKRADFRFIPYKFYNCAIKKRAQKIRIRPGQTSVCTYTIFPFLIYFDSELYICFVNWTTTIVMRAETTSLKTRKLVAFWSSLLYDRARVFAKFYVYVIPPRTYPKKRRVIIMISQAYTLLILLAAVEFPPFFGVTFSTILQYVLYYGLRAFFFLFSKNFERFSNKKFPRFVYAGMCVYRMLSIMVCHEITYFEWRAGWNMPNVHYTAL